MSKNTPQERKSYSLEEARQVLGISRSLVYKLAHNGTLPTVRLGERRLVVPVWAIDNILKNGTQG